jgi:O-antigen ligase
MAVIVNNEVAVERWESAVQEGGASGRTEIFREAFRMFTERPLAGWGPVRFTYELGDRLHYWPLRDTHNQLLGLLTEVGILGTIPYLAAVILCFLSAWKARHTAHGILPLAMLVTLVVINASLSWQNRKPHWIILAYALASGLHAVRGGVTRMREGNR